MFIMLYHSHILHHHTHVFMRSPPTSTHPPFRIRMSLKGPHRVNSTEISIELPKFGNSSAIAVQFTLFFYGYLVVSLCVAGRFMYFLTRIAVSNPLLLMVLNTFACVWRAGCLCFAVVDGEWLLVFAQLQLSIALYKRRAVY